MAWMRRLGIGLLAILVLLVAAALYIYWQVESRMYAFQPTHEFTTPIPADEVSIARGWHIIQTSRCQGCHGVDLMGQHMDPEIPWFVVRLVAPNIAQLAKTESPAKLEVAIRQGIRHDGRSMIVMPSAMFAHLTDQDTADVIAVLKSIPAKDHPLPKPYIGPVALWALFTGSFSNEPELIAKNPQLRHQGDADQQIALGEYTAMTNCTECHGLDLRGADQQGPGQPPDLAGARGYSKEAFTKLMRTGVPADGRELAPLMSGSARFGFSHFTDEQIDAIHAYLNTVQPK